MVALAGSNSCNSKGLQYVEPFLSPANKGRFRIQRAWFRRTTCCTDEVSPWRGSRIYIELLLSFAALAASCSFGLHSLPAHSIRFNPSGLRN